ncbi:MAG: CsgG/HfaB family protein [Acidobacteriota bacterium]|nr:CsgG/HfaB family protein [Acidobacteriota bacterium]MDH3523025.1 CsgG/HfaB family protein [Acidobacteriota bacterium]
MTELRPTVAASILIAGLTLLGCSGNLATTEFTNPRFDFGFVERVAVMPLEDLAGDRQAGLRATRMLITELLASGAVDVVEPGELQAVADRVVRGRGLPSKDEILELGRQLEVQAVIVGSVTQSEVLRSGAVSVPVVTLDLHMLETETGTAVWAVTHTERGSGAAAKWLGTGAEPISATTRKCVQEALRSLFG